METVNNNKKKRHRKRNNNNNEKDIEKKEVIDVDKQKLKEELDNYLKINEDLIKSKDKEEELAKKIKKKTSEKLEEALNLKKSEDISKLYDFTIEIIKQFSQLELNSNSIKIKNENITKELNSSNENSNFYKNKFLEQEKFNKMLLDKLKQNSDEKKQILEDESKKREEMVKKCEDFMKEVQGKFENSLPEKEELIKENENLRNKLEQASNFIKENFDNNMISKTQKLEEEFKNLMNDKVKEVSDQAKGLITENTQLKTQLNLYSTKFDELNSSIKQYNGIYETLKKEVDKVRFYFILLI